MAHHGTIPIVAPRWARQGSSSDFNGRDGAVQREALRAGVLAAGTP